MSAIVLNGKQAEQKTSGGYREKPAKPEAVVYGDPSCSPKNDEGDDRDHELERTAQPAGLPVLGHDLRPGSFR